jgi:AcrR family transcriptional regulator
MPRIVDHDKRRSDVVEASWRVIERVGVENATLRDIASEMGTSIGSVTHYFATKDDLLGFAFQRISEIAFGEIERTVEHLEPGLARLRVSLERMLPGPGRRAGVLVSMSFWGHAATNAALGETHRAAYARWRGYVRKFLKEALERGEVDPALDVDMTVPALVSLVDGLLVAHALEPKRFVRTSPAKILEHAVSRMLGIEDRVTRAIRA